jgi:hypothetical protein
LDLLEEKNKSNALRTLDQKSEDNAKKKKKMQSEGLA